MPQHRFITERGSYLQNFSLHVSFAKLMLSETDFSLNRVQISKFFDKYAFQKPNVKGRERHVLLQHPHLCIFDKLTS